MTNLKHRFRCLSKHFAPETIRAETSPLKKPSDALHAIQYVKNHKDVDPARIGYLGHSNGGEIGLRALVIAPDIKAASLWAGVVGSYEAMFETYLDQIPFLKDRENPLVAAHGTPSSNPNWWNKLEPYSYLGDITAPIQLQHGTNDTSVPIELSRELRDALQNARKEVTYIEYAGDDHNISRNYGAAWKSTIEFFKKNL